MMKLLTSILVLLLVTAPALADSTDDAFAKQVNIDDLKNLSIQHNQTLKTFDSFSRQILTTITGKRSIDGRPAVYTILDMTFRPDDYKDRPIIKIKNTVLRNDFKQLDSISEAEKQRIIKEGTISLRFWFDPKVQNLMSQQQSTAVFKMQAINQVQEAAGSLMALGGPDMHSFHIFAPATMAAEDHIWKCLPDLFGTVPAWAEVIKSQGGTPPPAAPGYDARVPQLSQAGMALLNLRDAWVARDAGKANQFIATLATTLPQINPERYPSDAKRNAEVVYNRLAQLTIPGIMLYFAAFVLFIASARSGVSSLRLWALRVMIVAFLVHTAGIAIRWWLVEKSVGNYFEAIPIKNMFESVMFSAWFGALVGLILEMRKSRGLFGAAASFVGTLAMVALFSVPYFFRDIGGEIGQVAGVLMSYWLYIHVTMVVASYALIGMGFLLSVYWLWVYYREAGVLQRVSSPARLSADAARDADDLVLSPGGGAMTLNFTQTLASLLFLRKPIAVRSTSVAVTESSVSQFLAKIDACNLVVLQLAFWLLGVGIILGAVWADMSWGRPWGWDPKETFALVTWIVYLIVVHVRVVTADKAWWTAVLSIVGFAIMMFNWIGVNFFLVGLHSYA